MVEYFKTYKDLPSAPVTTYPSDDNKTGMWRTFRPIIKYDDCIRCFICWKFCPDVAVHIEKEEHNTEKYESMPVIDYEHCKGCGICANECPKKCIEMVKEE